MKQVWKLKQTVKDFVIQWQFERLARQLGSNYGSPFIIIGMHRSGTSLVTRLLREAGGYFAYVNPNYAQSQKVVKINE